MITEEWIIFLLKSVTKKRKLSVVFIPGGAPRQTDRRVCAAAKGVFFKKAEMHCKGGPFDKCTVRGKISVNLGKTNNFCAKSLNFLP